MSQLREPNGRFAPWSEEDKKILSMMIRQGHTDAEIASVLSRSRKAISKYRLRNGLLKEPARKAKNPPARKAPPAPPPETIFEKHARETKEAELRKQLKEALNERTSLIARQNVLDDVWGKTGVYHVPAYRPDGTTRAMTLFAALSDCHIEERVEKGRITFSDNEYNPEIAEKRLAKFFDGVLWFKYHHQAYGDVLVNDCVLGFLGDLITGYIHEELMEGNFLSPVEAILWMQERLTGHIKRVANYFDTLTIACVPGNHGRTTQKYKITTYCENSYEWLMYKNLEAAFSHDPRIKFVVSKDNHQYVQVYNTKIHVAHFDDIKYNGGVGGVSIPLLKRVAIWNQGPQRADVHVGGHFHQKLDLGHVVCNGSLIGYNAFGQSIGARPEPAQQAMFMIDSERGKCLSGEIWCE